MHPLKQLQKLMTPKTTNHGRVIAQQQGLLTVATCFGTQAITPNPGDVTKYVVGDTVRISNGQVLGKRIRQPTIYVI